MESGPGSGGGAECKHGETSVHFTCHAAAAGDWLESWMSIQLADHSEGVAVVQALVEGSAMGITLSPRS